MANKMRFPLLLRYSDESAGSGADVIELSCAKQITYRLGLKQRREGDHLLVFRNVTPEGHTPFYADYPSAAAIASLYIDEGIYEDVLVADEMGTIAVARSTLPWHEYVDFVGFLKLLVDLLAPEFKVAPSPYIGRGYSQQHYTEQYAKALAGISNDEIEFYERQFGRAMVAAP